MNTKTIFALCAMLCALTACSADEKAKAAEAGKAKEAVAETVKAAETKTAEVAEAAKAAIEKSLESLPKEASPKDISYTVGYMMASGSSQQGVNMDPALVVEAYELAFDGKDPKFDDAKMQEMQKSFMEAYQKHMQEKPGETFTGDLTFPSYVTGMQMGAHFASTGADKFDMEEFKSGLEAGINPGPAKFSEEQMRNFMTAFQLSLKAKAQEKVAKIKQESADFLAANAKKEGVTVTPSGLQYEVVKMGEGEKPAATSTVKVHYRGTTIDGKEFDSSYKRNEPTTFPLNGVIKGWTEGLQLMPCGSTFRFYIPSELGYGERGAGANIPGGAALIFDVELLEIVKPAEK